MYFWISITLPVISNISAHALLTYILKAFSPDDLLLANELIIIGMSLSFSLLQTNIDPLWFIFIKSTLKMHLLQESTIIYCYLIN
jgi:hypothetical protein